MRLKKMLLILASIFMMVGAAAQTEYMKQWPQFRGPFASGIVETDQLPDQWDVPSGKNIRWKLKIPGLGHSSPVIWGDRVFITTAISGSGSDSLKIGLYGDMDMVGDKSVHEFRVYCIDRNSGEIIWERLAHKGVPVTERHTKSSQANPTPATDGKYVIAFFGSNGMYCYDFDGKLIWTKNFGRINAGPYTDPEVEWGYASSPIIHENKVTVQCDIIGGQGFLASLDLETGNEIWRTPRNDVATWSSPNFLNRYGERQIVVNGYSQIGGYDFDTGKELWRLGNGGDAPVPTPLFSNGLIYIHGSHGRYQPIFAIRPEARGNITLDSDSTTSQYIVWSIKRGGAYLPTDLIYRDYLYNLRMNGNLTCFNALTGELIYRERIPDAMGITSSGVASNGRLYYSLEQGDVVVVQAGPEFKILSRNHMDDLIMATPAISKDMILFRTVHYLVAVGEVSP